MRINGRILYTGKSRIREADGNVRFIVVELRPVDTNVDGSFSNSRWCQ